MESCRSCGAPVERAYRYCPWCATPQRTKLTEFFPGHPELDNSRGRALRVSRYFGDGETRHVRFSVWNGGRVDEARAEAAMSIDAAEAERLGRFLLDLPAPREPDEQGVELPGSTRTNNPSVTEEGESPPLRP